MKSIARFYQYCNYLSLDVACGAMVCAAFFSRIMHVQLRPYGLASLGLTVWIIYTTDHLLDARQLKQEASSERHRFHQMKFRTLATVLIVAILIDLLLLLFVRKPILNWGIALSLVILVYLWWQQKLVALKELAIALLYSAGVLLPALSLTTITLSAAEITLILSFVLTAFINLVLFSWYDWDQDILDHHSSLVTFLGRRRAKNILIVLFLIQAVLLGGLIAISPYQMEALMFMCMNVPLFILFLFPTRFSSENLYRQIGDIIFVFPVLYLF